MEIKAIPPTEALERLRTRYGVDDAAGVAERALRDEGAGVDALLDGIAVLHLARSRVDELEAELLRAAHEVHQTPWSRVASALGVRTRQAAEQRFLRRVRGAHGRDLGASRGQNLP